MAFEGILNILNNGHGIIKHNYIKKKIMVDKNNINFNFNLSKVNFEIIEEDENTIKSKIISGENIINQNVVGIVHHFFKNKAIIYCGKYGSRNLIYSINIINNLKKEDYVKVKIINVYDGKIYGEIIESLGDYNNKNSISKYIEFNNNFNNENKSYNYINELKDNFQNIIESEKLNRINNINLITYTIDPIGSKDLDDALSIEEFNDHYKLYIHIADVSFFIKKDDELYSDALNKSFSTYLPDYVIKMFPQEISEDMCSIHENKERLVVTTEIKISKEYKILDFKFYRSIIKSIKQFTYEEVKNILETNNYSNKGVLDSIKLMYNIYNNLKNNNKLKIPEIAFSDNIKISYLDNVHKMIEEMMILNNKLIAEYFSKNKKIFIGRSHEKPTLDSNYDLMKKINNNFNEFSLSKINEILDVNNKNYLINLFLIQQIMPKARYDINNDSHWGLNLKNYSHFTSPIRRFSDLVNHYLLFDIEFSKKELLNITRIINKNEDDQQKLNYELINIKRFQNLRINELNYKNKIFNGIIINVSNPRILVFIKDLFISQEIHIAKFSNNKLMFDEIKKEYIGEVNIFIGKEINLKIIKINYCSKILEFEILDS